MGRDRESQESLELADRLRMLEQWRWHDLYKVVLPTLIACMAVFITVNFFTGKTLIAVVQTALLPPYVFAYVMVRLRRGPRIVKGILLAGLIAFTCLPIVTSMHLTAWYSLPLIAIAALFLLLGQSRGSLIVPVLLAVLGTAYFLKFSLGEDALPLGAQINFYLMVFLMAFLCYFNETTKARYQAAMVEAAGRLERLSNADELTGLFNRRYFDRMIRFEWKRHSRTGQPVSLILCDLDFFKEINDSAGHMEGDRCLKTVAAAIRDSARRESDLPARFGGDEFAVLLTETGADAALVVAKRIRETLSAGKRLHPAFGGRRLVTLSIGVCTAVPSRFDGPEDLVAAADRGMYRSKRDGRNRISVEPPPGPRPDDGAG